VNGEDVLRFVDVGFDLLPEPSDVIIHGSGRWIGIVSPHLVQKLVRVLDGYVGIGYRGYRV
jgi:hypothetical protein